VRCLQVKCLLARVGADCVSLDAPIWHRGSVRISDLDEGRESERATLKIAGECIAVKRLYEKDIATDELFELLGGER
jgi:hypothetical protein